MQPAVSDVKRAIPDTQIHGVERKINPSAPIVNATAAKDRELSAPEPDLRRKICENGPCKEPEPKPVDPGPRHKICTDGPCQPCPGGQTPGKDGSCEAPATQSGGATITPQQCVAGQGWDGHQCVTAGAEQTVVAPTDCTVSTANAQNVILRLSAARSRKNAACGQNATGKQCRETEAQYNLTLVEYQAFLGGVPSECRIELPDPFAI